MAQASNAPEVDINDVRAVRRAKRQALIDAGINPYPIKSEITAHAAELAEKYADLEIDARFTLGESIDTLAQNGDVQARRDQEITLKTTLGKVLDIVGEDKVKAFLEEKAAEASYTPDYAYDLENVVDYWLDLFVFIVAFAILSTVTLEFIDRDKR